MIAENCFLQLKKKLFICFIYFQLMTYIQYSLDNRYNLQLLCRLEINIDIKTNLFRIIIIIDSTLISLIEKLSQEILYIYILKEGSKKKFSDTESCRCKNSKLVSNTRLVQPFYMQYMTHIVLTHIILFRRKDRKRDIISQLESTFYFIFCTYGRFSFENACQLFMSDLRELIDTHTHTQL